jgi:trimeric autotransporter adhesin
MLYGMKTAAQNKGATAIGAKLTIDQLKPNYIVVLTINNVKHFEVVQNIINTTIYLLTPLET